MTVTGFKIGTHWSEAKRLTPKSQYFRLIMPLVVHVYPAVQYKYAGILGRIMSLQVDCSIVPCKLHFGSCYMAASGTSIVQYKQHFWPYYVTADSPSRKQHFRPYHVATGWLSLYVPCELGREEYAFQMFRLIKQLTTLCKIHLIKEWIYYFMTITCIYTFK